MPKIYVIGEELEPKAKYSFKLNKLDITIGRGSNNHVVIKDDDSLSVDHCVIRRVFGGYVIKDLNSIYGITLNGERIQKADIKNASMFMVGNTEIRFTLTTEEITDLLKEPNRSTVYVTDETRLDLIKLHAGEIDELPYDIDYLVKVAASSKDEEDEVIDLSDDEEIITLTDDEDDELIYIDNEDEEVVYLEDEEQEDGRPTLVASGSGASVAPRVTPQMYTKKGPNVGLLIFFSLILGVTGFIGGLALKHNKLYSANFFKDYTSGKLK